MRRVVLQMMTSLNGRVDGLEDWVKGVGEDAYAEVNRQYASFDTVLMGAATYSAMAAYWPAAEQSPDSVRAHSPIPPDGQMAHMLNTYRKVVFSTQPEPVLAPWANVEVVHAPDDAALIRAVVQLKARPGRDLHLAGGARLAQTFVRLGLVDRYQLFIHPALSAGATWFDQAPRTLWLKLIQSTTYAGGIVANYYEPAG